MEKANDRAPGVSSERGMRFWGCAPPGICLLNSSFLRVSWNEMRRASSVLALGLHMAFFFGLFFADDVALFFSGGLEGWWGGIELWSESQV